MEGPGGAAAYHKHQEEEESCPNRNHVILKELQSIAEKSGAGCSKLTTSLVNVSLKF